MHEITVTQRCDFCRRELGSDKKEPHRDIKLGIGRREYLVDSCGSCWEKLVEPVLGKVAEVSRQVEKGKRLPMSVPSGNGHGSANGRAKQVLGNNTRVTDGRVTTSYDPEIVLDHVCPDPDCPASFSMPQGLGVHVGRKHKELSKRELSKK